MKLHWTPEWKDGRTRWTADGGRWVIRPESAVLYVEVGGEHVATRRTLNGATTAAQRHEDGETT
jgi:hypothetical protein